MAAGLAGAAFAGAGLVWADTIEVERMLKANKKTIRTANFLIFFLLSVKYKFLQRSFTPRSLGLKIILNECGCQQKFNHRFQDGPESP